MAPHCTKNINMTIEFEQKNLLNKVIKRGILEPGKVICVGTAPFMTATHIHALSPEEIEVRIERPGEKPHVPEVSSLVLAKDEINRSRHTRSLLGGINVVWKPTPQEA